MITSILRQGLLRRVFLLATFLVATISGPAVADELFAFAGNGDAGFSGDGGAAVAAELNLPHSVAVDSNGNVFIADYDNHRIRRVAVNGMITTIAGTGTAGFSGDGGLASVAELNSPIHIVVDAADDLFVLDFGNRRVRKITTATGIITTIAGNGFNGFNGDGMAPTSTNFNLPWGIALDAAGDLYIADRGNHRIRKADIATAAPGLATVTTVAGNGTQSDSGVDPTFAFGDGGPATLAQLNSPHGIHIDAAGNMYIADTFNHRIRMVDAATGSIRTIAGELGFTGFKDDVAALARFRQPRRLTLSGTNLYIADSNGHRVRVLDTVAATVSTVAGDSNAGFNGDGQDPLVAELNRPNDVFVAGTDIYIADTDNARVRVISADSPNAPPTDINLDNDTILSSGGANALVGTLSSDDPNGANVHTYTLVAGAGDTDNSLFDITGDQLSANDSTAMSGAFSIRVMTHDGIDASFVKALVVNVTDDVAPVIALTGADPQSIPMDSAYVELGATASDNVDGTIDPATIVIDASAVDTATAGDYAVLYDVSDAAGNAAVTVSRTVTVVPDTTAPVITLLGSDPQVIANGGAYVEAGATALDDIDGDLSAMVMIDASAVNTAIAGNYAVLYEVTDAAGNTASVNRTVTVQAAPPPPPPVGGSSGGCTMGPADGTVDPTLPLLVMVSLAFVLRRRMGGI